jgi:hypothetical protein
MLRRAGDLESPTEEDRQKALALISIALAPAPKSAGALELRCDSSGLILYDDIIRRLENDDPVLAHERTAIQAWMNDTSSSYAIHTKIKHFAESSENP